MSLTLKQIVSRRLDELGLGPIEATKDTGLERTFIRDIIEGRKQRVLSYTKLANALGLDALAMEAGEYLVAVPPELHDVVPILSQVSAGRLSVNEPVTEDDVQGKIVVSGLGKGSWAALIVAGNSMNKVAPDGSTIVFNRSDRRAVDNGFFVFKDQATGAATFKRWGEGNPPWLRPYSYDDYDPIPVVGDIEILGRVRKVVVDL